LTILLASLDATRPFSPILPLRTKTMSSTKAAGHLQSRDSPWSDPTTLRCSCAHRWHGRRQNRNRRAASPACLDSRAERPSAERFWVGDAIAAAPAGSTLC